MKCPDCDKDWGHSYCGTCSGSGTVSPSSHNFTDYDRAVNKLLKSMRELLAEILAEEQAVLNKRQASQFANDGYSRLLAARIKKIEECLNYERI